MFPNMKKYAILAMCAIAWTNASAATDAAADWPNSMVKIVVPFPPGGTTDAIARLLADNLGKELGQQFIVENRSGANTQIGTDAVARANPDGRTFLLTTSPYAILAAMSSNLPYNPRKDLVPVIRVAENAMVLVANPQAKALTVPDMIAAARANPGTLTVASVGTTGMSRMSSEMFAAAANIEINSIPYKGTGQVMPDLLGGQVDYFFDNPSSSMPQIRSNKLVAIAYTGSKRSPAMPDVPTIDEAGLKGFETVNWYGIMAPAGTPAAILDKLNTEVAKIMKRPEVVKRLADDSVDVIANSRSDFTEFLEKDLDKWAKIVKERKLSVN